MKPTNYHLFDFLDFDPDLSRDESLWKAYKPTSVYEKDGDICINVPFQKQVLSNDMAPDTAFPVSIRPRACFFPSFPSYLCGFIIILIHYVFSIRIF